MAYPKAYEEQRIPSPGNPRYSEAWALIEAARRMATVVEYGDLTDNGDRNKLREALRLNLRIWTFIQAEQAVGDNPLPDEIRQNILTLCKFIDKHTIETMVNPSPEKVVVLIDINRNIASGLLGNVGGENAKAETNAQLAAEAAGGTAAGASPHDPRKPTQSIKIEA